MKKQRPRILIIGHARHGKDTVAEILRDEYGLSFASSSDYVGRKAVWPMWGQERYDTYEEMFEDRVNNRELWSSLINAYNTPDKARTGRGMIIEDGMDMYVGMRAKDEFEACMKANVFNMVVWVDGSLRKDPEDNPKMTMTSDMANYVIENNGTLEDLEIAVGNFADWLVHQNFEWEIPEQDTIIAGGREFKPEPHPSVAISPQPTMNLEKVSAPDDVDLLVIPENAVHVLDHGYVSLVDTMGTDADIAEAARLSYGRGTKKVNKNEGLIRYLYSHHHTSPFEMVEMKFQMRLPIFIMRQWVRHRTANLNEYSGRYSIMPRLFYIPKPEDVMGQSKVNKQGSEGALPWDDRVNFIHDIEMSCNQAFDIYEKWVLRDNPVSREMARIHLPLNTYTEIVWKMDLNNMLKFLWLRDDSHAQPEIQAFARVIAQMVEEKFPLTYAAYQESRNGYTFTRNELFTLITGDYSRLGKSAQTRIKGLQIKIQQEITAWLAKS